MVPDFLDQPPESTELTDYDRTHMALYLRVLDATNDGAELSEVAQVLFGLDAEKELDRAKRVIENHLARARWMTEYGYRLLLGEGHN
jgi:hypothetical protein